MKSAAKAVYEHGKAIAKAIKKDPWKFVATAAAGLAATIAVGALCATGIGCLILAGAVAGAMSAGTGFMVDVARGDQQFSVSGLVGTMVEGGLDGALSAGISKVTGGITSKLGIPKPSSILGSASNKIGITTEGNNPLSRLKGEGASARPSAEAPQLNRKSTYDQRANDVPRLQRRAQEAHGPLDEIAAKKRDTVAMSTEDGPDIFGTGVRDLSPSQRRELGLSDEEARMGHQHAEVTTHETALSAGLKPNALSSYPHAICPSCREYLELEGYRITEDGMSAVMRTFHEG